MTRLIDASGVPVWAISSSGKLVYLSSGTAQWLGVEVDQLVDRRSIAGAPVSDDPLDQVAAALSPPPGLAERGTASLRVHPPGVGPSPVHAIQVRFVRVGNGDGLTIAIGGEFNDRSLEDDLHDAVAIRQRLDAWRRHHTQLATIATAGVSPVARRMRLRLQVAASTRTHVGFFGPPGSGAESIATRVHQQSAPGESMVTVDGPLMDTELLDATMIPLVNQLADSSSAKATALVRGLDEMPLEAQQRLAAMLNTYASRLRLLAICGPRPSVLSEPLEPTELPSAELGEHPRRGIHDRLIDHLSGLTVTIEPLCRRVEDIPLMAAAAVDARHAAGEGNAERLSRNALDALVAYPWPGNFEELDGAMRQAMRTAPRQAIGVEHLPLAIRSFRAADGIQQTAIKSLDAALRQYETRLIEQAIEATDGNRAEAARRLGISRARLIRRIDQADSDD